MNYYRECDKNERLEREIFHIEEERDIVKDQLKNWQNFYESIKPNNNIQISWCDLCIHKNYDNPEQCVDCTMGSGFEYDEVTFGEIKDE